MNKHWQLLPTFAIRMTGFPIEKLTSLRLTQVTQKLSALMSCEAELTDIRQRLLEKEFPDAVGYIHQDEAYHSLLPLLSSWRHTVGHRVALKGRIDLPDHFCTIQSYLNRWNELLSQREALLTRLQAAWESEFARCRLALRQTASLPDIQEAIFLSNPDVYFSLQRYLAADPRLYTSAMRKFERRLISYIQRFCAKNETNSFFGPINYGELNPDQRKEIQITQSLPTLRERKAFPCQWMIETLARAIASERSIQPYLKPRRGTLCFIQDNQRLVFPATGQTILLEPEESVLFSHADGKRTVADLAALLNEDWATTWQRLKRLEALKAIVLQILIPGNLSDPLAYLQNWLLNLPSSSQTYNRWHFTLGALQKLVDTFGNADLPQRIETLKQIERIFSAACGELPQRTKGAMYVDRTFLFEECLGNVEQCTIGGTLVHKLINDLQPILDIWYAYGQVQLQRDQHIAYQIWKRLYASGGGSRTGVPFLAYLQAAHRCQFQDSSLHSDRLDAFLCEIRNLVRSRSDGHVACLQSADFPSLPFPATQDHRAYTSFDIMIAASSRSSLQAGDYQIVIGESHSQPLLHVFPTAYFMSASAKSLLNRALHESIAATNVEPVAAQMMVIRKNKIFSDILSDAQIELRPFYPDTRAIPLASIRIREVEGTLQLWAEDRYLRLYTPLKRWEGNFDPLAPFAFPYVQSPPIYIDDHTPRIEINGIICQRERWSLSVDCLKQAKTRGFDLFLNAWRWKERHGLPLEVFVQVPGEPKPIYIDFSNYFLVELLCHFAEQCEHLVFTEMLPHSCQLWLDEGKGHHSCEFRMFALHLKP